MLGQQRAQHRNPKYDQGTMNERKGVSSETSPWCQANMQILIRGLPEI